MAQFHSEKLGDSIPLVYDIFLYVPVFPESRIQSFFRDNDKRSLPSLSPLPPLKWQLCQTTVHPSIMQGLGVLATPSCNGKSALVVSWGGGGPRGFGLTLKLPEDTLDSRAWASFSLSLTYHLNLDCPDISVYGLHCQWPSLAGQWLVSLVVFSFIVCP